MSRSMRVGILGSVSAVGGLAISMAFLSHDDFMTSSIGGALTAILANQAPFLKFSGLAQVAAIGAISSFAGKSLADRLVDGLDATEEVPFRGILGLVLGGGVAAISTDRILPPEIKLLS